MFFPFKTIDEFKIIFDEASQRKNPKLAGALIDVHAHKKRITLYKTNKSLLKLIKSEVS